MSQLSNFDDLLKEEVQDLYSGKAQMRGPLGEPDELRLVRDAENLWAAVDHERGLDGRDAVWRHPDLMPTRNDLQDPLAFTQADQQEEQPEEDEMDRELRKLLESEGRD